MRKWMLVVAIVSACGGGGDSADGGADAGVISDAGPPDAMALLLISRIRCEHDPLDVRCEVRPASEWVDGEPYGITPRCPLGGEEGVAWRWGCDFGEPSCVLHGCGITDESCRSSEIRCVLQTEP